MSYRPWPGEFTYCPHCATALAAELLGDRPRMRCPSCRWIHWRNPAVGAAAVVHDDAGRLLMIRRRPGMTGAGLWSIPAGFVEYGEDIRDAAARELHEETGIIATIHEPVWVASNFHEPAKLTVGVWFTARMTGGELAAGDDADAADWFALDALPPLAFDTDRAYLRSLGRGSQPKQNP